MGDVPATLEPPAQVLSIAAKLEGAGYETWCVGGSVRDALLGHPHADWDLATAATPEQVMSLFRRTVPVGVEFGTVGVLDREGTMHEVTTFRRDVRTDGRHAEVEFGVSLDDDLARRDFTINAIAYSPSRQVIRDPFGGRGDLSRGLVRAVGVPVDRMREDRLRALRALRFAARFGFEIEPRTWAAIESSAPHLIRLSPERVKQELEKTMEQVNEPARALRLWRDSGALAALIPGLAKVDDVTLQSLNCLPRPAGPRRSARRVNRLTALFAGLPERAARDALRTLRFSNSDAEWISKLVGRWGLYGSDMERALSAGHPIGDVSVRHWVSAIGRTHVSALLRVAAARWGAARALGAAAPPQRAVAALYRRAVRAAFHDALELSDLAIGGDDLVRSGIPPGPDIGEILQRLLAVVLDDPSSNTHTQLLELAHQFADGPEKLDTPPLS